VKLPSLLHERVAEIGGRVGVDGPPELEPLDEAAARIALRAGHADGIRAVAIVLMHAWAMRPTRNASAPSPRRKASPRSAFRTGQPAAAHRAAR
jgi:hypothetical protein